MVANATLPRRAGRPALHAADRRTFRRWGAIQVHLFGLRGDFTCPSVIRNFRRNRDNNAPRWDRLQYDESDPECFDCACVCALQDQKFPFELARLAQAETASLKRPGSLFLGQTFDQLDDDAAKVSVFDLLKRLRNRNAFLGR